MTALVGGALAAIAAVGSASGASGKFLLIRRDRPVEIVAVAEIGPHRLVHRDDAAGWTTVPRDQCVALLDVEPMVVPRTQGWLRLADGQRFPGEALSGARPEDGVLVWIQSSWLGRMEVPLDRIESVTFVGGATVPAAGDADTLQLANGDRLEGLVTALGDPITVEVLNGDSSGPQTIELPLDRVVSARMVTPAQEPKGRRLWLMDGTVVDVEDVMLGDDGFFRLEGMPLVVDDQARRVEVGAVVGVQFESRGLIPFAEIAPSRVDGPPTRYVVPAPAVLDEFAPLGLGRVEFRGPISVQYQLPAGSAYLSAEAALPVKARSWGDCELVIREDDQQIFSTRLNAERPSAVIGLPLDGSRLTVEVTEGSGGPVQDQVVLLRALVLISP
ncbi:MAG: hypothetical protein ACYS15_01225 [Planctomycetota bacterium]